jgi:two-component system response regulator AtoC
MPIEKVLVVDDELLIRSFLTETLSRKKLEVTAAENGKSAVALLKENTYDLVFTDMKMPDLTGLDVLKKVKELSPSTIVVVITAFGTIDNAIEAMRLGAFHYLIKPFSPDMIEAVVEKANEHSSIVQENQYLRQEVSGLTGSPSTIIAESPIMKQVLSDVQRIAQSNANVMITGESGTGKEVIANAIHFSSPRVNKPYVRVNCAAIPETLVESEFFGHEKGAFTGALNKRCGRFELANEGTLLLDEITEVPFGLQAKLLRAVQEQEFERVGGTKSVKVDVRIISTSNRDIQEAIQEKVLREDLYYRLNVVPIHLPPLRERREDIVPLAEHFLTQLCGKNHKKQKKLTTGAKQKLMEYRWPGNVRELANIIERAIVLDISDTIEAEHLHIETPTSSHRRIEAVSSGTQQSSLPKDITLQELERRYIIETLQAQQNNRAQAAKHLGISVRTLQNKLNEYDAS